MQNGHSLTQTAGISPQVATQQSSDQDLIESIAAGDKLAMRTLYGRHNVRVYRFVRR